MTSTWRCVVSAAPGAALAALLLVVLLLAAVGRHPWWQTVPLNLSEAVVLRDGGDVVRLIREGSDPDRSYPIRSGLLRATPARMTPVEAAMAAGRPEMLAILIEEGALPPDLSSDGQR